MTKALLNTKNVEIEKNENDIPQERIEVTETKENSAEDNSASKSKVKDTNDVVKSGKCHSVSDPDPPKGPVLSQQNCSNRILSEHV